MIGVGRELAVSAWLKSAHRIARLRAGRQVAARDLSRLAIVGSLAKANGISRGAQLQYEAAHRAGLDPQLVDTSTSSSNPFWRSPHSPATAYVLHAAAPQTALLLHRLLPDAAHAWRIGYWAWELPEPPQDWRGFDDLVSEIWTPSTFSARALKALFSTPIRIVPHQVRAQPARYRNIDGKFICLVIADSRSSFSRKNPMGAVEAFRKAFGNRSDVHLVVKLNGFPVEMALIERRIGAANNISFIKGFLDNSEMDALYRSADVLLSLHRAEGFGLPMLEAMSHGVPVVGTGWSGNMDFMTEQNSVLIPYELVPVEDESGVYGNDYTWAEPDVDAASNLLRSLREDEGSYAALAEAAHRSVAEPRPLELSSAPYRFESAEEQTG